VGDPNKPNRIWGLRKTRPFTYLCLDQRDGNSNNCEYLISFLFHFFPQLPKKIGILYIPRKQSDC
jgi:hypothetical protein